jgi:hypothetical protein
MKTTRKQNLLAFALLCALGLISLFPAQTSAATVVVATGRGRYYHHGAYYNYHPRYGGYYNYSYGGRYYVYYNNGRYYNHRVWVAPKGGRRGYYRYR